MTQVRGSRERPIAASPTHDLRPCVLPPPRRFQRSTAVSCCEVKTLRHKRVRANPSRQLREAKTASMSISRSRVSFRSAAFSRDCCKNVESRSRVSRDTGGTDCHRSAAPLRKASRSSDCDRLRSSSLLPLWRSSAGSIIGSRRRLEVGDRPLRHRRAIDAASRRMRSDRRPGPDTTRTRRQSRREAEHGAGVLLPQREPEHERESVAILERARDRGRLAPNDYADRMIEPRITDHHRSPITGSRATDDGSRITS
jgi:hypothetical protein